MSDLRALQPDEIELDIPGGEPDLQAMRETAVIVPPESRSVDRIFAFIVTFAPPIGFIAALVLHFQGWYRIGWIEIGILLTMWFLPLTGVELGFHRLFAHGSYKAHRAVRYVLAVLGSMAFQGPVVWWASVHRKHHRTSDREGDPHSPYLFGRGVIARSRGFVHAHIGWIWTAESIRSTGWSRYVWDLYQDEDLFRIHMHYFYWLGAGFAIPAVAGGLLHGSWQGVFLGFLWGGLVRVFFMNHLTYWCINSVTHSRLGTRPYETADRSSNNWLLAIPTMGQTWHNNHHAFPSSSKMGHRWWEIDTGMWILLLLQKFGLVWRLRVPSERMMRSKRRKKWRGRNEPLRSSNSDRASQPKEA